MDTTSLIVSAVSATIAAISVLYAITRASKTDLKDQEHRLTVLEQNQFTSKDRECLHELDLKVGLWWKIVEKEFPKMLKGTSTPELDGLLDKIINSGLQSLNDSETEKLDKLLQSEVKSAVKKEDAGRAIALALYHAVFKFETKGKIEAHGCK